MRIITAIGILRGWRLRDHPDKLDNNDKSSNAYQIHTGRTAGPGPGGGHRLLPFAGTFREGRHTSTSWLKPGRKCIMRSSVAFMGIAMAMMSQCAQSADLPGLSFSHNDWELVCDNTRTCRAAGYSADGKELSVSVLLTRKAGPSQPVTGELMIGQYGENEILDKLPPMFKLSMRINQRALDTLLIRKDTLVAKLSARQVKTLLAALTHNSEIEWVAGENSWHLSDKGAAAVLLKMDEYQGRIGTQGALLRRGSRSEDRVLPPLPVPVVMAAPLAKSQSTDNQLATNKSKALREALRATVKGNDDCPDLLETETADDGEAALSIARLTEAKLLVSTQCWRGAYNIGYGYWVIDDNRIYHPVLITTSGSDYSEGSISASHKGRGLGDCWSSDAWTWDGKQFVHTESSSTGMCRLLAPGGAWSLPQIITEVRYSSR